jgi:hypothetical protein
MRSRLIAAGIIAPAFAALAYIAISNGLFMGEP